MHIYTSLHVHLGLHALLILEDTWCDAGIQLSLNTFIACVLRLLLIILFITLCIIILTINYDNANRSMHMPDETHDKLT